MPPSQSSRVGREEVPTWERARDWKEIRAGGSLIGLEQLCSCYFACSNLPSLQTPAILCVVTDLGGEFHARSPGFHWDPFCPRQGRAWACTSSEPGKAEVLRSSPRPGGSTKCRSRAGERESRRLCARGWRQSAVRGPRAPRSASPSELLHGAFLPGRSFGSFFVFNVP